MKTWFTLALLAHSLMSACASTPKAEKCENYRPLPLCSPGFEVRCQTTRDGCEQCGCVPIVDDSGRAPYELR
jgi:hypothetical protein